MNQPCFECGNPSEYEHHVVPRSKGGTKTIPLCGACHGKAHFWDKRMSTGELTRAALQEKRRQGKRAGNLPFGWTIAEDGTTLTENPVEAEVIKICKERRKGGTTFQSIADELTRRGYAPKAGKKWHCQTIKNICGIHA